jgi:hypothetical protein
MLHNPPKAQRPPLPPRATKAAPSKLPPKVGKPETQVEKPAQKNGRGSPMPIVRPVAKPGGVLAKPTRTPQRSPSPMHVGRLASDAVSRDIPKPEEKINKRWEPYMVTVAGRPAIFTVKQELLVFEALDHGSAAYRHNLYLENCVKSFAQMHGLSSIIISVEDRQEMVVECRPVIGWGFLDINNNWVSLPDHSVDISNTGSRFKNGRLYLPGTDASDELSPPTLAYFGQFADAQVDQYHFNGCRVYCADNQFIMYQKTSAGIICSAIAAMNTLHETRPDFTAAMAILIAVEPS